MIYAVSATSILSSSLSLVMTARKRIVSVSIFRICAFWSLLNLRHCTIARVSGRPQRRIDIFAILPCCHPSLSAQTLPRRPYT